MKSCEDIYEKILLFDELSPEEQQQVTGHTEACSTCRTHLKEIQAITASLKRSNVRRHIQDELLTRYSIYLSDPQEPDYDGTRLSRQEITVVEQHLGQCHRCQERVEQMTQEYRQLDTYLEEQGVPQVTIGKTPVWWVMEEKLREAAEAIAAFGKSLIEFPIPRFYPVAVATVATLFVLVWVSPLFRGGGNMYANLLSLERPSVGGLTRGDAAQRLADGLAAFEAGRYDEAIGTLERFVETNPQSPSRAYAHYVLGMAYLLNAKSDLLGRFERFDQSRIDAGIRNLQHATQLTENVRIKEDAYWFMGMGYLMAEEGNRAKEAFGKIVQLKGRRLKKAQEILLQLRGIPGGPR